MSRTCRFAANCCEQAEANWKNWNYGLRQVNYPFLLLVSRATDPFFFFFCFFFITGREPKRVGDDISINWMPALRSFQIRGLLFSPSVCSVPCLCDIFTPDEPHDLQEIQFLVDTDNSRRNLLNWSSWSQLDALLSGPKFPSLKKVDVTLVFSRPGVSTYVNVTAFQNSMPRLIEQGKLAIRCD